MIRIFHVNYLQKDNNNVWTLSFGEVWIEGKRIIAVYPKADVPQPLPVFEREIDGNGDLLMPGFQNMHTHSAMVFLRALAENLPLDRWLHEAVFPYEALLTKEDVVIFSKLAMLEYLRNGITSIFDMYHFSDATAKAARDCGVRLTVCGNINRSTGSPLENEQELRRQFATYRDPMTTFRLGCHAEYTCDLEQLKMLAGLSDEWQAPVFAHMSETKKEVEECKKRYNKTPVALFEELGLFAYGGGIFHGIWLEETDYTILKKNHVGVISNPASNVKLASGIAPIKKLQDAGICVGLGTDGAASNNALDMFREMYLACTLQKIANQDAASISSHDVLNMALFQGAKIVQPGCVTPLQNNTKTNFGIEEGKWADVILLRLSLPNMQPDPHVISHIVYSANPSNIRMTMVNGVIRYWEGEYFVNEPVQDILKEANARRLFLQKKRGLCP